MASKIPEFAGAALCIPSQQLRGPFPYARNKTICWAVALIGKTKINSLSSCMHTLNGVSEEGQEGHGVVGLEHGGANLLGQMKPDCHFAYFQGFHQCSF